MDVISLFFFNDTATTEIYTLSLHDALPICAAVGARMMVPRCRALGFLRLGPARPLLGVGAVLLGCRQPLRRRVRSEEHTSELQSRQYLVCRLLLEKKKNNYSRQRMYYAFQC